MGILVSDFGRSAVKHGCWDSREIKSKGQFATPESWEEIRTQSFQVCKKIFASFEVEGIRISSPGVVNSEGQVIEGISAIPYIHEFNILRDLETLFQLPVTIENDADCAGMAEFYEDAVHDYQDVAFVVTGTGIGGTLFAKRQINKGAHLYGGEFGLMFLNGDRTPNKLDTAVRVAWRYCECKGLDKNSHTRKDVFELAETGDTMAKEKAENFCTYLTKGLFNIQFSFDPEVIVLDGGASAKRGLIDEIKSRMKKLTEQFSLHDFEPQILLCEYRNDANLADAAANYLAVRQGEN